jgi:hypothetical protein
MSLLELETQVWPTPNHIKLVLSAHLNWIARKLGSPRPKTVILRKGDPIPKDAVLKRTHSDQHQHVRIPGQYVGVWEDFTLPHRVLVESMWGCGAHMTLNTPPTYPLT